MSENPVDTVHESQLKVIVRPLPKVVFFYMTWLASLGCACLDGLFPAKVLGLAWMAIFIFNLVTIAFDFTADRCLMLLLIGAGIGYGFYHYSLSAPVQRFLQAMNPVMNQGFYMVMFGVFTIVYIFVWIQTRVNYWEFRPNEVIHRCGFFSRAKRYRPELIKWDKMVPDILERIILGTGTMILTTSQEDTPVILEHVPGISNIDDRIASVLNVQVTASR